jgi:predicted AlkP superfamily pyrophosphatase or phosphodiesterase
MRMETMLPWIRRSALLLLAAALFAVGNAGRAIGAGPARTVIMISLDGTTPADVRAAKLPTLEALARRGAAATRLVPVFPTNTFPNHVSLVTGVVPAVHGIVNNSFLDPQRGSFRYSSDPTWIEVEPLWAIASRHGIVSASYYWIGSEGPWKNGHGPRYWKAFDSRTPESEKVEQILAWLDIESPDDRPRLITSWFHGADGTGHRFGPGSSEVYAALRGQDRALARLLEGLDERGAFETATLLLVSDHGMAPVARSVDLKAALRAQGIEAGVFGGGGLATVSLPGGARDAAKVVAVARSLGLDARLPDTASRDLPMANPRFGDVVVLAPTGTAISSSTGPPMRGAHGYPPDGPDMGALLIAAGGGVCSGCRLPDVRTLDVAPTVLAWLGIAPPAWMEGRPIAGLVSEDTASEPEPALAPSAGDER